MLDNTLSAILAFGYIPHGHCYLWQTPLVGLHAISDGLIAVAYFSIPIALVYFVYKRKHDFPIRLLILFGSFIMLCGIGHFFDIVTLWYPVYWASGGVRAATAIVSCYTAMEVVIVLPYFLSLESPEAIEAVNRQLQKTVAKRVSMEKALESSQRVFKGAFNDAPIGMALVSLKGNFLNVNKAFTNMLGYSKEELIATNFQSITYPDDLQADLVLIEELLSGARQYYQFEKRYFHKTRRVVPVQLSVALLKDSDDAPLYFIAHIEDISQQKQFNASLLAATKASESASQAKSEFLAAMSHEIRTPMNAMIGMTELLEDTNLDDQQQDFVEVISKSGNTLLTVINDILDFSKIESNKLELEMHSLNLYECTEDVLALFSNQAAQKGLCLTVLIEPANIPDAFRGDAVRLKQILSNLVSNSIKFTKSGEVSICIRVNAVADKTKQDGSDLYQVQFSVRDTGIGIPEEKLSRLFQPFSQVDASTTRQYGGTGLGLAISQNLIKLMGGKIEVESQGGVGSTFYFSIQLEAHKKQNVINSVETQVGLKQKRLLVVDSNELSRRHLLLQTESWHLEVATADSAESALVNLFHSPLFDVIIIDEMLADMEYVQLASQIRNFPNYQTVPIVILQTGRKGALNPLKILGSKVKLLQKPIRRSQLYNALVEVLLSEVSVSLKRSESLPSVDTTFSEQKPLRILLTEDILLNQKVALQMLASYGYQADVANNGKEAVNALANKYYDLVFMDVQMPEMDGLEATGRIRTMPPDQQPYIVAMTAHSMQGDREECLAAGMDDYIGKPIRKQDIVGALQRCPIKKTPQAALAAVLETSPGVSPNTSSEASSRAEQSLTLDTTILEGVSTERDFLIEICHSFSHDAPQRIEAVQQALSQKDALALRSSAHALKSLSGCVGAMSLFQVCKSIENAGKSNQVDLAIPLIPQVNAEYEKVRLALQDYQSSLQPA